MYYVYEFYIVDTGEIIYVGKGSGKRYKVRHGRNQLLKYMFENFDCESRIVKTFNTEKEAFEYEYERIKKLKALGLCVCNIYCGGAGGSYEYWTDEMRKEFSMNNVMKSEKQKKRMSENNPMKNKALAQKVNGMKKRPVVIGNNEYASVKEASEIIGVATDTIIHWCKKGINANGELCKYKDSEQIFYKGKRYNKGGCRGMIYNGIYYESPKDLAVELNCNVSRIYIWLKQGFDWYGNEIRYNDDHENHEFKRKKGSNHPIIVNGKRYISISSAARDLGISSVWLGEIVRGKHKSTKYICEYDNQQPSWGNTYNSIPEGSETNR